MPTTPHSHRLTDRRALIALTTAAALILAACGDDGADSADTTAVETTLAPETTEATPETTEVTPETTEAAPETTGAVPETTEATPETTTSEPDTEFFTSTIDDAAQAMLEAAAANGATAVHVAISDPTYGDYEQAYGTVSVDGDDASLDDNFPIGSITKTFTAVVILQMVENGDLSLDDTVGDLLPDLATEFPDLAPLTVQQLLSMTSGVEDYLNVPDSVVVDIVADPTKVWEPEELIAGGVSAGVSPPGTPGYSTTNYIVLQLIAESIGGAPLEELITSMVTDPLGLESIFLPPPDDTALPEPFTHGYIAGSCIDELADDGATVEEGTDTTDWNTSFTQGGGGMVSTIDDLLSWAESMNGNTLLGDDLAAQRLETAPIGGYDYGLGMLQVGRWFGHAGEAIGWEALAVQNPDTGVSVALAGNGCGGLIFAFANFLDTIYPEGEMFSALLNGTSQDTGQMDDGGDIGGGLAPGETNFVAGEVIVATTWTACSWDGTNLTLSAENDDSQIEVVPGGDGVEVTVTGAEDWTATGMVTEADGTIVVTGKATAAADPANEVDFAMVANADGCS